MMPTFVGDYASLLGFTAFWVPSPSFLGIPNARKIAPICLLLGQKKNWANAVALKASLAAFSLLSPATSSSFWLVYHLSAGRFDLHRYHHRRFGCTTGWSS